MAKQQVDLSKLTLGAAKPVVKTPPVSTALNDRAEVPAVEKAVEAIHPKAEKSSRPAPAAAAPKAVAPSKLKALGKRGRPVHPKEEDVVRVSVDLPRSLYKRVKMKVVQEEITLFEYFARLAERDLAGSK